MLILIIMVLLGLFLLLPFLTGFSPEPAELPKYLLFCFICIISLAWVNFKKILFTQLDWLFLIWLGVALISTLLNQNLSVGIFGQYYRYQGLLFYFLGWLLTFYLRQAISSKLLFPLLRLSGLIASFALICSLFAAKFGLPIYQLIPGRFAFTFGNPNFAGAYLALSAFFLPTSFLFLPILGMLATGSLSSLAGLIYLISTRFLKPKFSQLLFFIILIAGFVYPLLFSKSTFDQKHKVWFYSFQAFWQKPLLGWGRENTALAIASILPFTEFELHSVRIDKTHNLVLEQLVETGLVGLIVFLTLVKNIYESLRKNQPKYLPLLATYLLISQFNVINITTWLFFFLVFALSISIPRSDNLAKNS